MNDSANRDDPTTAMSDGCNNPESQTEEERIFVNEVSDDQLEPAASGPIITRFSDTAGKRCVFNYGAFWSTSAAVSM